MLFRVDALPDGALDAAARFFERIFPGVEAVVGSLDPVEDLLIVFPEADHAHRGWRLAAVQELARKHAPRRVNAAVSADEAAIAAAAAYLSAAPGVTGQLLALDGNGAGEVLSPSS